MNDLDAVVIGAGAAGLAATHRLRALGLSVIALEARGRIGGRAWAESETFGVPIDRGCAWLHSADINPWRSVAADVGCTVIERNPTWRSRRFGNRRLREDEALERNRAIDDGFTAIDAAGEAGHDVSASDVVDGTGPYAWLFEAVCSWVNGVQAAELSTLDHARYSDTGNNWPVVEGYGAVVARYGAGLPVRLNTPVSAIEWGGGGVVVSTPGGALCALRAVVALPPSVLADGSIRFMPALPVAKQEAIHHIPLGIANKAFLAFDGDPFDMPEMSFATAASDRRRAVSLQFRPFGQNLVMGYLGGTLARELELAGSTAMTDFVLAELVAMFGSAVRQQITRTSATAWYTDPWSRGSYSAAHPGHAHRRADLAAPLDDKLFFAGEACSTHDYSTCHGAYLTGLAAADAVAATLRRSTRGQA
jgi:monoamine oxidase